MSPKDNLIIELDRLIRILGGHNPMSGDAAHTLAERLAEAIERLAASEAHTTLHPPI